MNTSFPFVLENFLSPFECAQVTEQIGLHKSECEIQDGSARTLVSVRDLYACGKVEAAALADNLRRRCVREALAALRPPYAVWPDYMMYQGNYEGDSHVRHSDNSPFNNELQVWEP